MENAKQMFKDMKNDDDFTNRSTTEVSKVICDGIDNTFACDFSDQIRFVKVDISRSKIPKIRKQKLLF